MSTKQSAQKVQKEESISAKSAQILFEWFDGLNFFSNPISIFGKASMKPKKDDDGNLLKDKEGKIIYEHDPERPPICWIKTWNNKSVSVPLIDIVKLSYFIVGEVNKNSELQEELKKAREYNKRFENKKNNYALPF